MKKKSIVTIVAIVSLSLVTMAGCGKEKSNDNNVNETVGVEATNEPIDTITGGEPITTDDGTPEATEDSQPQSSDGENNLKQSNDGKDQKEDQQTTNTTTDKDTKELPIYTINEDTLETEDAVAYIPANTEVTAKVIVDEVVKAFSANSYEVKIVSTTQDGDNVIVNFEKDCPPSANIGAAQESSTLDCISHSILDNLPSCKAVIFRLDGEAYVSGHIEYGINEPYSTGNTN